MLRQEALKQVEIFQRLPSIDNAKGGCGSPKARQFLRAVPVGQPEEAQRGFVQPEAREGSACIADQLQFLITVLNASHRCQPFVFPATQLDCRNQKALNDGMAF